MKTKSFLNKIFSKGFTLIELLIVIAVLGVLATAVLVAINPTKRINQAKDSTIKSDIAQIASAMQAYYTTSGTQLPDAVAYYPLTVNALVLAKELKTEPLRGGVAYSVDLSPALCDNTTGNYCSEIAVYGELYDTETAEVWCWRSETGVAAKVDAGDCTAVITP